MSRLTRGTPLCALLLLSLALPLQGQGWRDKLKKAATKVEGAAGEASKGADKATQTASSTETKAAADANSAEAEVSYDFVPGTRVLFQDDFSQDPLNDLPTRVKIPSGSWEIVNHDGRKMLRCTDGCNLMIPLGTTLPDKFTFEAEVAHGSGWDFKAFFLPEEARSHHNEVYWGYSPGIGSFKTTAKDFDSEKFYHARVLVDGEHAKVYLNNQRTANVPEAMLGRSNAVWLYAAASTSQPLYIASIRIAASEKSLFDALSADGRVATHGILFATGSDQIQPASGPTLQEIGQMLQQHADLKLTIEGHTDNVGQPAANLTLSQKRADAVKQYLVKNFQVDASRLETKGYGDTKPVAANTTDEGRQQNRRVELVKM